MNRRQALKVCVAAATGATLTTVASAQSNDDESQKSLDTVMALMGAMGRDDMVWLNEGDPTIPWIGPWNGKEAIFGFLGVFSENFKTTKWENTDILALGDTVAIFGDMNGVTTKSGQK